MQDSFEKELKKLIEENRRGKWREALSETAKHPLLVNVVGFLFTGIAGGLFVWWLNERSHAQDVDAARRSSAIAAVSDLSDLVNERRERGALVVSAIRRGAPESEVINRKTAYDEAYVRWNAKVPGDLLRIRAWLGKAYGPEYERYIDGLTNVTVLLSGRETPRKPGLFSIMDACLTQASDSYRQHSYTMSEQTTNIMDSCRFSDIYSQSVTCFSRISQSLYSVVNEKSDFPKDPVSYAQVVDACRPP